ncbi:GFA family protein [Methylovirgula sp. 4M-Z18]|uniref:GFA family protein n=1 Tax=Methylovirgula sp. 4M-Z18 TaxID=2293567 RepID=UPI000E2FE9FF|nr:GFA family protein [Methylovirgula sp. 4M-Z18]RFB78584.1 GFA family protein [Methylovirgula sp. 4M-Z18]
MTPRTIHHGGCLCGAVRYEAEGELRNVIACHCTQCRKQSGHFAAMTSVPHDRFVITKDDGLSWYSASPLAQRGFCRICGSNLFWQPTGERRISITGGTFDGPLGVSVAMHIFCADKGDYYEIDEGVKQLAAD